MAIAAGPGYGVAITGESLPPQQVTVKNPATAGGSFSVQVPTQRGRVYELEYKNSLADPQWMLLALAVGTGDTVELVDPLPGAAQRFYRVRRW